MHNNDEGESIVHRTVSPFFLTPRELPVRFAYPGSRGKEVFAKKAKAAGRHVSKQFTGEV